MKKVSLAVVFIMCLFALDFPLTTIHICLGRAQRGWGEKKLFAEQFNRFVVSLFANVSSLGFFFWSGEGERKEKGIRRV